MKATSGIVKSLLWSAAILLFTLLLCFMFRNPVLRSVLGSRIERFNAGYNADLRISKARFEGISTVFLSGISLKAAGEDSLLKIDTLVVSVNAWRILEGRLNISSLEIRNLFLTVYRRDSLTNYNFLLNARKHTVQKDSSKLVGRGGDSVTRNERTDYAEAANRLFRWVFDKIPGRTDISNLNIRSTTGSHVVRVHLDRFPLLDHGFSTMIRVREDSSETLWNVSGILDSRNRYAEFALSSAVNKKIKFPYIGFKWNASFGFDSLRFSLSAVNPGDTAAGIRGRIAFTGLEIYHKKIAADTVKFQKFGIDYHVNFEKEAIELDSATDIAFNGLDFHPYLKYRPGPPAQITFRINKPPFPSQDLFSSLPQGLFINLQGLKTSGELSFFINFFADLSVPDSLKFEMELKKQQFAVNSYGDRTLLKLDSAFMYTAFEDGLPVRTFEVGAANPNFRRLSQVSPYLQYAVMTSEDGGFYLHRGFIAEAFRDAIIADIKEGRFVRGGSTISMQLVKNVFLSRNKTMVRKLEEALIVWLIENQQLATKDRIYEVYLNIIEWGPLIYGANEASRFYFNKEAGKLTLAEAIFMASIIPRPKWFKYNFDEDGRLRASMADFYRLVSGKMLNKGWISQQDFDKLVPEVTLRGPARMMLKNAVDTTMVVEQ
ncbi:MAG: biosynthetic peptidoglycan transglycosylase [Bacteroidota bacterium]|jgi:Transglycosylase